MRQHPCLGQSARPGRTPGSPGSAATQNEWPDSTAHTWNFAIHTLQPRAEYPLVPDYAGGTGFHNRESGQAWLPATAVGDRVKNTGSAALISETEGEKVTGSLKKKKRKKEEKWMWFLSSVSRQSSRGAKRQTREIIKPNCGCRRKGRRTGVSTEQLTNETCWS